MSGNAYPRSPPQGYNTNYTTANQFSQGYAVTGSSTVATGVPTYTAAPTYAVAPPYTEAPPPYTEHPQNPQMGVQQNLCFENAFDYRARFDGIAQPRIPPPPPGVAPNAAQIAAMQGHNVTATQEHRDVMFSFD